MFVNATWDVAAGTSVTDLISFLVNSNIIVDATPSHEVVIQNNGTGTLRVGAVGGVSTSQGVLVGPGELFRIEVQNPGRVGVVGDQGLAANNISVILAAR